jgi:sec-independent protein translocase protein TatA
MDYVFGFLDLPAPTQLIVLLVLAVLLFGQNLPQVARSMGQKLTEFRRGLRNVEDEIRTIASEIASPNPDRPATENTKFREKTHALPDYEDDPSDRDEPTAPKFEPPANY